MCVCVRACVRACVHACVRACVRVCVCLSVCVYAPLRIVSDDKILLFTNTFIDIMSHPIRSGPIPGTWTGSGLKTDTCSCMYISNRRTRTNQ